MKNSLLLLSIILGCITSAWAEKVEITQAQAWLESAYVEWSPVADATSYNVYYKHTEAADADYQQIDVMLIREYAEYFRADAVGLAAGNYVMKVVPVVDETENTANATTSETLAVKAHRREGFAFSNESPHKTGSGAYNDNGTLRAGAQVIYVTSATAKTVTLDVITNNNGATTRSVGIKEILANKQKGRDQTPLAIRIVGAVTASDMGDAINSSGFIEVKGSNAYTELNTTIEGIGEDATVYGWGVLIRQVANVEVRNLGFMHFPEDGVSIDTKNQNLWVHNNDFFYGQNKGGDKNKGDGSLDIKTSGWVTISYNHFWDSGKCNLLGNGKPEPTEHVTFHHNWYDHSDSRHPRVRAHTTHVYNNYFDGNSKYGVGATYAASIFVESNFFRNSRRPMMISLQGTDIAGSGGGTFSSEPGGIIKAYNNHMEGNYAFVTQNESSDNFDAIDVSSRSETVPATYKTKVGNNTYNNFDTAPSMYTYNVQTPEEAKAEVMKYAGRINGGDFKFTFNNAVEDTNSDVIPALESAIKSYTSKVVSIGFGEETGNGNGGGDNGGGDDGDDDNGNEGPIPTEGYQYIPDKSTNTNSFFTITGSLTNNGAPQAFGDVALGRGLKMDSKGVISFTTATDGATMTIGVIGNNSKSSLKLMYGGANTNKLGVGGTTFSTQTITLGDAGAYEILKGDNESWVYYVVVTEKSTSTNINDIQNKGLVLYPNPVTTTLNISSDTDIEAVKVYNMTGALVKQASGNIKSVDMSALPAGIYTIAVQTASGVSKQKVVK